METVEIFIFLNIQFKDIERQYFFKNFKKKYKKIYVEIYIKIKIVMEFTNFIA